MLSPDFHLKQTTFRRKVQGPRARIHLQLLQAASAGNHAQQGITMPFTTHYDSLAGTWCWLKSVLTVSAAAAAAA